MTEPTLHQLADSDAMFLSVETENAWGHVSGLSIIDSSETPGFSYERFVSLVEERLPLVPRFTWKLVEVPLGLDRPYWTPAENFDVRRHVTRVAVRKPGTIRELAELVGRLNSGALRRDRPLWHIWFIEGVEGGKHAMFMKSHHCLMDGQAGAGLAEILCDLMPDGGAPPLVPEAMREAPPRAPEPREIAWNAVRNAFARGGKRGEHAKGALLDAWDHWRTEPDEFAPPSLADQPQLPWNTTVSERRGFSCASLDLAAVKAVKKHFDVTLNDVVLEVAGGALRSWLARRDELPDQPIVAMVPVSLREAGDSALDNQVTNMSVALATDLPDPADRLRRIHKNAKRAKEVVRETRFDLLAATGECFAPGLVNLMNRFAERSPGSVPMPGNVVVSNVRGTPTPLYTAGAPIEAIYPMSVLNTGLGLNLTVVSYRGKIDFGFCFDPDLVPDGWELAEGVTEAFAALESAVEVALSEERGRSLVQRDRAVA
jgi:WS/DGAT/MGAT family acyltransferase